MGIKEDRFPLRSNRLDAIPWTTQGERVRIDPAIEQICNYAVYRYASIAEALLMCEGKITFAPPHLWPDKYESFLAKQLFGERAPFAKAHPYLKCFSVEYSSEAMWRIYSGSGGLVRVGIPLKSLIGGLEQATWPSKAKIYVGRVRYMEPPAIRKSVDQIVKAAPKPTMNNAMPALLMKRSGFIFENEIRVATFPGVQADRAGVFTARDFPVDTISRILVDPYLPKWQADALISLFKKKVPSGIRVERSSFDSHPVD